MALFSTSEIACFRQLFGSVFSKFSPAIVLAMNWRSTLNVLAVFLASVLTSACNLQQPSMDWNGTWKLNASKSSVQGQVITISVSADGEYRSDDGFVSTTFRCDGKYRPIGNNRTQACVKSSATTLNKDPNGKRGKDEYISLGTFV